MSVRLSSVPSPLLVLPYGRDEPPAAARAAGSSQGASNAPLSPSTAVSTAPPLLQLQPPKAATLQENAARLGNETRRGRTPMPAAEPPSPEEVARREADTSYKALTREQVAGMSLAELAQRFDTPMKVNHLFQLSLRYQFDLCAWGEHDYFATPDELWRAKQGDCEDYAWFAKELLDRAGYATEMFYVRRAGTDPAGNGAHMVLAVRERNGWNQLSNDGYVPLGASSLDEIAASVFPRWTEAAIWRRDPARKTLAGWGPATSISNPRPLPLEPGKPAEVVLPPPPKEKVCS
jgi:predicted transglutaminase-like cysteine proteinase